jgi:hypothetical protein
MLRRKQREALEVFFYYLLVVLFPNRLQIKTIDLLIAPFANSGQGFHDASWLTNWVSNANLTVGSGGCVNTPPSIMKTVYENLNTNNPVVV